PAPAAGLYDDFADPAFDGTWNPALWEADSDKPCQVEQQEGVIRFEAPAQSETTSCALALNQPSLVSAEQLGTIEARLQIADDFNGEQVNLGIGLGTEDLPEGDWFAFCGLTAHPDEAEAYFEMANYGAGSAPDISQGVPAAFDRWYTFRLEVTPDPLTFACFVEDTHIGSVTPTDAPALSQARFHRALDYEEVEFGQIGFVEARLKLDSDISAKQGAVSVLLTNSLDSWAGCGLAGNADIDQAQLSCNVASFRNEVFAEVYRADGPAVDYDTWHTVRIEMNPESGELTFFADDQPIGTHTPEEIEPLKTAQFNAELQLYLEDGSLVTGYFDDIQIGPAQ
ncbi:MAG: hypothetical protein HC875_25905, partial [Anaerolineales bacterium]|nr:hypothetical protein [Anaerolineales bacterium]